MSRLKVVLSLCLPLVLLMSASAVRAATLYVNCGGKGPLTSIGAALKAAQFAGPSTVNVTGACHENVVIQSMDRLTLNAAPGASIADASGGTLDVILIADSRGISINNFTIYGGDNGIECSNESACNLNGDTVQGANGGAILANVFAQVIINGGTLQNNGLGLAIENGSNATATDATIKNNGQALDLGFHSYLVTNAVFTNNNAGAFIRTNGTLRCMGCQFTGNGSAGGGPRC